LAPPIPSDLEAPGSAGTAPADEWLALIYRCGDRDATALRELYALAAPMLLGQLLRLLRRRALAEEALQDVFLQVWQRAGQFDAYRGRSVAWLVSIARNRAIDILRRERADTVDPHVLAESLAEGPADEERAPIGRYESRTLEECLGRLSPEQRASLTLAYADGRSHQEVAARLDRPLGSVKSWIRRGLQSLKECLQSCGSQVAT
jgi:RNA polymerase sigma factor (sigma-70 family)